MFRYCKSVIVGHFNVCQLSLNTLQAHSSSESSSVMEVDRAGLSAVCIYSRKHSEA